MNRIYLPLFSIVLGVLTGVPTPATEPGFVSLFDGKTLDGWTINCLPKDKQLAARAWTVDDGAILANSMGQQRASNGVRLSLYTLQEDGVGFHFRKAEPATT